MSVVKLEIFQQGKLCYQQRRPLEDFASLGQALSDSGDDAACESLILGYIGGLVDDIQLLADQVRGAAGAKL